ncbi:BppU family phage baseplate upper protein [Enterococcus devriesei]|uniref:phage baseplate protein n=1 Tax=Enterococcus devriesei TaxID=319970 RepID=UPI001C123836|nr:BppU family phage baseplate upper protein [Enterococcus devriesei]
MYKSSTEIIVIDAKATEPISTNVVFWSHDHGTAKLIFKLQKDSIQQSLAEGTIVPICLVFNGGRHIYHAEIVDAVNGIVSIVLEDNILGYVGRVSGSIYIELPDSRSLDTAGRFTFDIKRSPIDENVPELEDYYWQGFNEIMTQYHETIATIKLEAKALLDSLTGDVTKVKNDIVLANTRIAEINQKIDDNDVFTKQESSANVIYQAIGKETVKIPIIFDFEGKIATSNVENPHRRTLYSGPSLGASANFGEHNGQEAYDKTTKLDGVVDTRATNISGNMRQERMDWNIVEGLTRVLGETFFSNQQAVTTVEKARLIRKITKKINPVVYGRGSSVGGNKLSHKCWLGSWESGGASTASSAITKLELPSEDENTINSYIQDSGFGSNMVYAEPSDGTTLSTVIIDYACLELTIELSLNQYFKTLIANNHVENLATQTEATTATDNTKAMTPLRTKQLLDSKLLNMVYPIGSIYMSVNSATPATLFGGTWERFAKGQVLVGVNEDDAALKTAGTNGGSTNPLTAHTHTTQLTTYRVTSGTGSGSVNNLGRATDLGDKMTGEFGSVTSTGDNTDHKNWQPFTTVYIWKRTA